MNSYPRCKMTRDGFGVVTGIPSRCRVLRPARWVTRSPLRCSAVYLTKPSWGGNAMGICKCGEAAAKHCQSCGACPFNDCPYWCEPDED
jgi:hypothetical protein